MVTAKTLGGDDSQLRVPLADDLALFADVQVTTCASSAARDVIRNGYNGCQSLNVWVSLCHGRVRGVFCDGIIGHATVGCASLR